MGGGRAELSQGLRAVAGELAERMVSLARSADADCLDARWIGPEAHEASADSALAFIEAAAAFVEAGDAVPLCAWAETHTAAGLVAFVLVVRDALVAMSHGGQRDEAGLVATRLVAVASRLADRTFARERSAVSALATALDSAHALGSPLSVVCGRAELARLRLAGGDPESADKSLADLVAACGRVAEERRRVLGLVPAWCGELKAAQGETGGRISA